MSDPTQPDAGTAPTPKQPQSVADREAFAESALSRDIEKARANYAILKVPKFMIPEGSTLTECYETENEWVILGTPDNDDESHNCDAMGCCTFSHVIARVSKTYHGDLETLERQRDSALARLKESEELHQWALDCYFMMVESELAEIHKNANLSTGNSALRKANRDLSELVQWAEKVLRKSKIEPERALELWRAITDRLPALASHPGVETQPSVPYLEYRRDGWPICPACGEDELYSLAVPATVETICGCYRCNWKPKAETLPQ